MADAFAQIGALLTLGLGLMGLFAPDRAARFTSMQPVGLVGRSEIRATYGGFFAALGLACLWSQAPGAFLAAGLAWVGAAAGRAFSVGVDASRSSQNLGGIVFELAIGGLLLAGLLAGDGPPREPTAPRAEAAAADLGPDDARIAEIRAIVQTGTANGAGTDNPVLLWFDNVGQPLSTDATRDFAPGARVTRVLQGRGTPSTLGALRRASIVLTLHLDRAEMNASWYCQRIALEVRPEGGTDFVPYLVREDVGWLSQDEPPRRSPAFALQ